MLVYGESWKGRKAMAISGPGGAEITAQQHGRRGGRLPLLSRYVLGQLLGPVALLTLLLTCVILLTESLRLLDLVINRGQSAPTFLYLTTLIIPGLLVIILPIAFFFGTLFTLSRLNGDSELVVMASAGFSQRQLAGPVFAAAAIVMALTWACALWLSPAGQRALSAKVVDIRADVAGALLNEGEFNPAAQGVTVFIRQLDSDGQIHGILVHDSRDPKQTITYIAQKGILAQTQAGARLMMIDALAEQSAHGGAKLSVLSFQKYVISLDQFAGAARPTLRKTNERYLGELLSPSEKGVTPQIRATYLAEAHNRLSQPLYCLAFAMICLAAILRGRRQRGALAMRLTMASLAAAALRIAGYGVAGPASSHPALDILFYLIPLLGTGLALAVLMGYSPRALLARHALRDSPA
jgi:lipopolysaccharide export system permease protein